MTTIEELNNKIDHLTQLVITLQETINQQKSQTNVTIESEMIEPKISLETWLQNTQMADIYINTLFENGCVSAFQKFILDHHEKARLPFAYKNNKLYVCNNNGKWILYDENIPKIMVEKTWKKFLNYYLNSYTEIVLTYFFLETAVCKVFVGILDEKIIGKLVLQTKCFILLLNR